MENQSLLANQKLLEATDILKEAYETFLQEFLVETSQILQHNPKYFKHYWPTLLDITRKLDKNFVYRIIQLGSLYLVPLHLLELSTVLVIVDLASKIYNEDTSSLTLKGMIEKPFYGTRLKGSLITFVYVIFLSTCTLLGLIWLVTTYFVVLRNPSYDILSGLVCGTAFVLLLRKYLEWHALWNMSLVISILEGLYGVEALALSAYFSKGNERRGFVLMLVFFVWGQSLRLPCLYFGCFQTELWIVPQMSLFCFGNVLKWVACVVYFHECKNRTLEKKSNEDVGIKVEAVDA
ncbi:Transmembrane protein [Parasponia andersonii]|uniref:Transmembrane protein n=1 Tax=Parasponia andersonii TaxID=3476 RepID=A0A2P5CEA2_PARAD|nr:Transmembrane protein [Parasponia andersonii]